MSEYPQLNLDQAKGPKATIKTNHGDIVIQLFPEEAPMTVENFVTFHRVISDFMIQGGDPEGTGAGGQSIWGHNFEDEFSNELFNLRGALSMANAGPNTNGSQFFIVQNKNMPKRFIQQLRDAQYPEEVVKAYKQGGTPWLDHRHTIFGHVTEGMDVVDEIAKVAKDGNDKPLEDVVITTVEIAD